MSTVTDYCTLQLSAAGFALLNPRAAMRLRPDLWPNAGMVCAGEFGQQKHQPPQMAALFPGAALYMAHIDGLGAIPVLAYSTDELERRINWMTGYRVERLDAFQSKEPTVTPIRDGIARHQARMEKLRHLAQQEPPSHDCHLRREILAARAELERLEPKPVEADNEGDNEADNHESAIDRAKELITDMLTGGPCDAASILAVAEDDNISERTMQRAAEALGVVKTKAGFADGWTWALPEEAAAA